MTDQSILPVPSDDEFRAEAARFLPICEDCCTCPSGWHFIWSAFKASGRRRSVYYQQPLLARLLKPTLIKTRKVLIAGAADSGILSVLASIFGPQVQYLVIDRCAAPLKEVQIYAASHGLSVRCQQVSLQDYSPQESFDLIFLHNTLGFLTPELAVYVLRRLGKGLHAHGYIACGMRYYSDAVHQSATAIAADCRSLFRTTFTDHPDLMQIIDSHIDSYAISQTERSQNIYNPSLVQAMITVAGYLTVDRYTDILTPTVVQSSLPSGTKVDSEVMLLRSGLHALNDADLLQGNLYP